MISNTLVLALATAAAASPLAIRDVPTTLRSTGISFVFNVTDQSLDFADNPVHGLYLSGLHVGAGEEAPIPNAGSGIVFYETGPVGVDYANNTIDLIGGAEPYGLVISSTPDNFTYGLGINIGDGSPNFALGQGHYYEGCAALTAPIQGSFAVCNTGYVNVPEVPELVLSFVEGPHEGWYDVAENIPANCVAVKLLAECATLDVDDASYDLGNVFSMPCYESVAAIDWTLYPSVCAAA